MFSEIEEKPPTEDTEIVLLEEDEAFFTGEETAENLHTLNFLERIHEKGDSDAFQEYMAFYNERVRTERAYILSDETGENVRYMSEAEYWQFVNEICGYMDYVEYRTKQILKNKNNREEPNG